MSKDSVKTQIDTDITNKTTSKSISPLNVGGNMKAVVDLIPNELYKSYVGVLNINGSDVPSGTTIFNNLCTSINWVKTSTGVYTATIVGGTFVAGKTFIPNRRYCLFADTPSTLNVYLEASNTILNVYFDNGSAACPGAWIEFEIRVYN